MKKTFLCFLSLFLIQCTSSQNYPLGSEKNPIKFFFVPGTEVQAIAAQAKHLQNYLEKHLPWKFKITVPTSYITVVESFGTKRADVAFINSFGYVLANKKYGVEALLTVVRHGEDTYRSQIVARADSNIKKLSDIQGKKMAYVDPSSTSGYLLPAYQLKKKGIKPKQTVFAQRHDNVITMLYQKQADVGAAFYSPPHKGKIQDARKLVKTQYPNVEKEVVIVKLTEAIPNEPVIFRKGLSQEMKDKIVDGLLKFIKTKKGREVMEKLYLVTDYRKASDKDYDVIRNILKALNTKSENLLKRK